MATKKQSKLVRLSPEDEKKLRVVRWKCRTDLEFLAREIIGYRHVEHKVHGILLDSLQRFPCPENYEKMCAHDKFIDGKWVYTPFKKIQQLEGPRRRLLLWARGHIKTTLNVQAHTLQWIINYPDIATAIFQSNGDKAEEILREIKRVFQYNEKFRALFPEHCPPPEKAEDWGKVNEFTTEARSKSEPRREPTVIALALDKATAGRHFEVIKFTDIVETTNTKTQERIETVVRDFYTAENLLVSPSYWIDVEGTRYVFGDLYGEIISKWLENHEKEKPNRYQIMVAGCYKKVNPTNPSIPVKYDPSELNFPFLLDENGKRVPFWPIDNEGGERFSLDVLEALEQQDPYVFSAQQLNNPIGGVDGKEVFAINEKWPKYGPPWTITREDYRKNVRVIYRDMVVDTAWTTGARSDYTAIIIGAWDETNRCYIEEIVHGKFSTPDLIKKIVDTAIKYQPDSVKMEKVPFNEGLLIGLQREMDMTGFHIPVELIKRDTQISKTDRISATLPQYYYSTALRFLLDIVPGDEEKSSIVWHALKKELKEFPLSKNDDILDALTDLFQNKSYFGRLTKRKTPDEVKDWNTAMFKRHIGIEDPEDTAILGPTPANYDPFSLKTGAL